MQKLIKKDGIGDDKSMCWHSIYLCSLYREIIIYIKKLYKVFMLKKDNKKTAHRRFLMDRMSF